MCEILLGQKIGKKKKRHRGKQHVKNVLVLLSSITISGLLGKTEFPFGNLQRGFSSMKEHGNTTMVSLPLISEHKTQAPSISVPP